MKYEKLFGNEKQKWFDIEVTIGNDGNLIEKYRHQLKVLLSSLTGEETRLFERALKARKDDFIDRNARITKKLLKLLLLWRFIYRNNLLIMGEILCISETGRALEKAIFLRLVEDLFIKNKFPFNVYAYCAFRKLGSPTTWLYFHSNISKAGIRQLLNQQAVKSLSKYLTSHKKQRMALRITEEIGDKILFFIAKSSEGVLVRGQKHNKEAQKSVYSLLILDLEKRRVGIISRSKKEIFLVHSYLKTKIFPDQLLAPRKDVECNPRDVFTSLLAICQKNPEIQIHKLDLKRTNLPHSPNLRLRSNDGRPINDAIADLQNCYKDIGISDLKSIEYSIKGQRANVYSYGKDEWQRRFLNVASQGKGNLSEEEILEELKKALELDIKETRFVIEKLKTQEIIEKILRDKKLLLEPPIPAYVEKLVTELVKGKLLKTPKRISKRICEDLGCSTSSWTDWTCPRCGRQMIVLGEEITIDLREALFNKELADKLSEKFADFEITKRIKQRRLKSKSLVHVIDNKSQVAFYIVTLINRKDISFLRALAKEGPALIALCHPQLKNRKDEIVGLGAYFLELAPVLDALKKELDSSDSLLESVFSQAFTSQKQQTLERIYRNLKDSEKSLREKGKEYEEIAFEIDIKNILQALVPKVVRLGSEYSGQSVPDGFCSFYRERFNKRYLFAWDAKFSLAKKYRLTSFDFTKQKKYIKWLSESKEPREAGNLWMYAIVSNFDQIDNYKTVLRKLSRWKQKPRNCKILLIEERVLIELACWILNNWAKILEKGPEISKTFFAWIRSNERKKSGRWIYCAGIDWVSLKSQLEASV
jgi:hypothetical protein